MGDITDDIYKLNKRVTYLMCKVNNLPSGSGGGGTTINGTGFVVANGSSISYDNSTYLTSVPAQSFASLTGKPTTISGYGITDFNSLGDARYSLLAHTHTFASLTSKPTTLAGYGISDGFALPSLTSGSVLFSNGTTIAQDNTKLFWDDTNYRLGVGTNTPASGLDLLSADALPLQVKTSTGSLLFYVQNANSQSSPVPIIGGPGAKLTLSVSSGGVGITNLRNVATDLMFFIKDYTSKTVCSFYNGPGAGGIGVGMGAAGITAKVHIGVGTTTAGTAPIKLTTASAALLTTPEAGAFETDGTDLYFTNSAGVRKKVTLT